MSLMLLDMVDATASECLDPRDQIYGLLSLNKDDLNDIDLTADYSKSASKFTPISRKRIWYGKISESSTAPVCSERPKTLPKIALYGPIHRQFYRTIRYRRGRPTGENPDLIWPLVVPIVQASPRDSASPHISKRSPQIPPKSLFPVSRSTLSHT